MICASEFLNWPFYLGYLVTDRPKRTPSAAHTVVIFRVVHTEIQHKSFVVQLDF